MTKHIFVGMCEDLTPIVQNPSFEGDMAGWYVWANSAQVTSDEAYSGTMSLAMTTDESTGSGVKQILVLPDT